MSTGAKVFCSQSSAPLLALFELLGRKCAMEVLCTVCEHEAATFEGFRKLCETISRAVLCERLKDLQQSKLLTRTREGYAPTPMGKRVCRELLPLSKTANGWRQFLESGAANGALDFLGAGGAHRPITRRHAMRAPAFVSALAGREAASDGRGEALWLPYRGSVFRLPIQDIVRMEAERDYVRVNDAKRCYLLRATLSELCDRLGDRFLRIHRSTAVARDRVVGLRHVGGGSWTALHADGSEFSIGRTHLLGVRDALLRHVDVRMPIRGPQKREDTVLASCE